MDLSLIEIIKSQYEKEQDQNIWENSKWKYIAQLENNNVGIVGEKFMQKLCDDANIPATIDGSKTKEVGGGYGDGLINNKSIEIKTARVGTGKGMSFQHELGEKPWLADYMIFVDIAPDKFYITIMPNFTEEQYKATCLCKPFFPSRSFCWRKKSGSFKFDTSKALNEKQSLIENSNTFAWAPTRTIEEIKLYIKRIIC